MRVVGGERARARARARRTRTRCASSARRRARASTSAPCWSRSCARRWRTSGSRRCTSAPSTSSRPAPTAPSTRGRARPARCAPTASTWWTRAAPAPFRSELYSEPHSLSGFRSIFSLSGPRRWRVVLYNTPGCSCRTLVSQSEWCALACRLSECGVQLV